LYERRYIMGEWIYQICYKGQTESAYTWTEYSEYSALDTMKELQEQYPDREWYVTEKDVS